MASRVPGDEKTPGQQRRLGRGRILIAEDDRELRTLLALTLEGDGFEVFQVEDGLGLSETLEQQCWIDVVISDARMPHRGGLDVLASLRQRNGSTPFVIITAFGSGDFHEEARRLGVTAVVDKPFEMDDLRNLVRRFTESGIERGDDRAG